MKHRIGLLIIGYFFTNLAYQSFPFLESYTFETIWYQLLFSPFSILGTVLSFIIGFFCLSRVIKGVLEKRVYGTSNRQTVMLLVGIFFLLAWSSFFLAVLAYSFAFFYGYMDIREKRLEKE